MVETFAAEVQELGSAIDVLSAMITPAILILASGSVLATTSSRLIRVVDRVRELSAEIQAKSTEPVREEEGARNDLLFLLLRSATRRARILQRAMTQLYLAVAAFILTSIAIGLLAVTHLDVAWIALLLGFVGALLLLVASGLLIIESRIALASTREEMSFAWKWGEHHLRVRRPPGPPPA